MGVGRHGHAKGMAERLNSPQPPSPQTWGREGGHRSCHHPNTAAAAPAAAAAAAAAATSAAPPQVGTYQLRYCATDAANNTACLGQTVQVESPCKAGDVLCAATCCCCSTFGVCPAGASLCPAYTAAAAAAAGGAGGTGTSAGGSSGGGAPAPGADATPPVITLLPLSCSGCGNQWGVTAGGQPVLVTTLPSGTPFQDAYAAWDATDGSLTSSVLAFGGADAAAAAAAGAPTPPGSAGVVISYMVADSAGNQVAPAQRRVVVACPAGEGLCSAGGNSSSTQQQWYCSTHGMCLGPPASTGSSSSSSGAPVSNPPSLTLIGPGALTVTAGAAPYAACPANPPATLACDRGVAAAQAADGNLTPLVEACSNATAHWLFAVSGQGMVGGDGGCGGVGDWGWGLWGGGVGGQTGAAAHGEVPV